MKEPSIYGQTHRMNWIFWITLPIIAGSTLLGLFLEVREQQTTLLELNWSDSESLTGIIITVLVLFLLRESSSNGNSIPQVLNIILYPSFGGIKSFRFLKFSTFHLKRYTH